MNYIEPTVLHEPRHRTLKPVKEILIEAPKSPELSPNHTPTAREMRRNTVTGTNRLKSPPLSDDFKSLLSPIPSNKNSKILFTIPTRVRNRLFVKKQPQQKAQYTSPVFDKKFAELLKKVNETNKFDLTNDENENDSPYLITKSKSKTSSIEESSGYEDNKEIEEITTPPSSQIESTHTSPEKNESPMKFRVYSTLSSTVNITSQSDNNSSNNNNVNNDSSDECILSPLHSLNSSPNTVVSPSSFPVVISSNNKLFQECMNSNTVSPLPMNDLYYSTDISTTDSPPAVKRSVRIINNPEIYDEDSFRKRRKVEKRVLSSNVEFELTINSSVNNNKYEIVNYPELSIIQQNNITKTSSFNKFLMGKRSKSILKMYGQKEYNVA